MNFKDSYKKDNKDINVRKEALLKLKNDIKSYSEVNIKNKENINSEVNKSNKLKINYRNRFNFKMGFSIVTVLLVFSVVMFAKDKLKYSDNLDNTSNEIASQLTEENNNTSNRGTADSNIEESEISENIKDGIYVPKEKIAKMDSTVMYSRVPILVYKNKVYYTDMGMQEKISIEDGKALMDKKIGVTWDLCSEIQDDGTTAGYIDLEGVKDFAMLGMQSEVYTVKGYNEDFRLITYSKDEYGEFIYIWECLNDFILTDGSDVFGKMNIKNNVESITWETFNSWNYGRKEEKTVLIDDTLDNFINALYASVPYSLEDKELRENLFDKESNYDDMNGYNESNEENQRFLYLKLKDGTKITLRLFKSGYVSYNTTGFNYTLKLDEEAFNSMWNKLN